jgi:hypothetical protein
MLDDRKVHDFVEVHRLTSLSGTQEMSLFMCQQVTCLFLS